MRFKTSIVFLLAGSACLAQTNKTEIKDFNLSGPYEITLPFMVDSTNTTKGKFDTKMLLDTPMPFASLGKHEKWNGSILPSFSKAYSEGFLSFTLDAQSYLKGSLKVKGPKEYKVYVDREALNGESLTLEPNRHQVVIRFVTAPGAKDSVKVSFESQSKALVKADNSSERLYTTSDCLDGLRVVGASLSPNGKYMIVYYRQVEHGGKSRSFVQVKEVAGGKILAEKNASADLQWMPKSGRYLYEETVGKNRSIYSADPVSGTVQLLARDFPDGNITVSPAENYLIVSEVVEGPKEKKEIYEILTPDDRQPGWRDRVALTKYDLKTGLYQRLTYGHTSAYLNDISADGKRLLLSVSRPRITKRPFDLISLYELNLENMKVDTLLSNQGFISSALYSPDEKDLLVSGSPEAFNGVGLNLDPGQTASMVDGQLFIYNRSNGKVIPATKNFNPSVEGSVCWSKMNGQVYFLGADKDCVRIYVMNPKTGKIESLGAQEDVVSGFDVQYANSRHYQVSKTAESSGPSMASSSPSIVYWGQSASNSLRLYLYNIKNRKSVCLEDDSKEIMKDIVLGECKDWNFVSEHGDTIYGRYYLPPHFDASRKYPMIVNYYGGCSPTGRTLESRYPQHAYAAQGYVVYIIQPSGATGFGQKFSARHVNGFGLLTPDEIIEGTKKFCAEHAFVNPKKIGCIGASYGGYMTQYLMTATDIFAAGISHAGISNQTSYWGEGYWGYSYSEIAAANSYPWSDPDIFHKHSPLFRADKVHTPLLFLHGAVDTNVPIGESIQMFTALKMLGRETAFVVVEGQDHHILDYNKRFLWQNTIFAWFAKWLKDEPDWWNATYTPKDF